MNKKIMAIGMILVMVATIFVAVLPNVGAKTILDESTIIEGWDYGAYEVWSGGATAWTVEIESTEPIDIRMMDEDNYNHWLNDESFKSYTAANVDDCTSKIYTVNLPEGKWYITLDNEDNEDDSEVSIRITAEDLETSDGNGDDSTPGFEVIGFVIAVSVVVGLAAIERRKKQS